MAIGSLRGLGVMFCKERFFHCLLRPKVVDSKLPQEKWEGMVDGDPPQMTTDHPIKGEMNQQIPALHHGPKRKKSKKNFDMFLANAANIFKELASWGHNPQVECMPPNVQILL